jgi:hypothetical protein
MRNILRIALAAAFRARLALWAAVFLDLCHRSRIIGKIYHHAELA